MMEQKMDVHRYNEKFPEETELLENGKLRFKVSGMEFSPSTPWTTLEAYSKGPALRRAKNDSIDYSVYLPHIVPHKEKNPRFFLFCKLTLSTIPKAPEKVQAHISGKKYCNKLKQWQKKQQEKEEMRELQKKRRDKKQLDASHDADTSCLEQDIANSSGDDAVDVLDGISITDDEGDDDGDCDEGEDAGESGDGGGGADDDSNSGSDMEKQDGSSSERDVVMEKTDDIQVTKLSKTQAIRNVGKRSVKKVRHLNKSGSATKANTSATNTSRKRRRSTNKVPKKAAQPRQRSKALAVPTDAS